MILKYQIEDEGEWNDYEMLIDIPGCDVSGIVITGNLMKLVLRTIEEIMQDDCFNDMKHHVNYLVNFLDELN